MQTEMHVDAMLCDYAQVHQGKLFISGASINLIGTPTAEPPHPISVSLGVLITVPWNATNQMHKVVVTVRDLDRQLVPIAPSPPPDMKVTEDEIGAAIARFNVGRSAIMQHGEANQVALALPIASPMPHLGPFTVAVSIDGTSLSEHSFRLVAPSLTSALGGPSSLPHFP